MKAALRPRFLSTSVATVLAFAAASSITAKADTLTWIGTVSSNWDDVGNWQMPAGTATALTPAIAGPPTNLVYGASANPVSTNEPAGAFDQIDNITFVAGAPGYLINGANISLNGGVAITNNSTATQTIAFTSFPGFGGILLNNTDSGGAPAPQTYIVANTANFIINTEITFGNTGEQLIFSGAHTTLLSGFISDPNGFNGQVVVTGPGKVIFTGTNTYTGDTIVSGGTLQVDGSIASLRTFVYGSGTLSGTGVIGGSVLNNGYVAPGDSPGTLTVRGNYTQGKAGTLLIEISGTQAGQHDLLAVGGQAKLDGTLRILTPGKTPRLKVGDKVTFLTAAGGVSGTFANVSNPFSTGTIVADQIVYGPNSVSLEAQQGGFSDLPGLTPNQQSVARALDKVAFHTSQAKLIGYLDSEPLSSLPADLDKIAPEELTSIFNLGMSLANIQTSNLQRRTDDIRMGSHGFSASGFAAAGSGPLYSGGLAGPNGNDGKESKEMKNVVPAEDRWGVFITGVGEWVNVSGDGNARGYDMTTGGFTVGADYKVTPNFAIGIDAGYAGTGVDLNNNGRVFVNGGKLGLYSTYFTGGFYVDTAVNGGYNSYDTRRDALQGTARGDTDGGELNVLAAVGYDFKVGGFTIGPTASYQYTYLGISDFNESGSLAPLSFPSQHSDSSRTAFGMKASYDWKAGGVLIRPEVRAAWQHEFGDSTNGIDSSFAGASDVFRVNGPFIGRDSLLLSGGVAIMWNERTSTYVYYDGELARTNYQSNAVSGGVRVSF